MSTTKPNGGPPDSPLCACCGHDTTDTVHGQVPRPGGGVYRVCSVCVWTLMHSCLAATGTTVEEFVEQTNASRARVLLRNS